MFDSLKLYTGEDVKMQDVICILTKYGYERQKNISSFGEYSVNGDTLIIYPVTFEFPVRIDLSLDKVNTINSIDLFSFKTIDSHNGVIILPVGILRKKAFKKPSLGLGETPIDSFLDIEPGDFVVHNDYGIGKYIGVQKIKKGDRNVDHFVLKYGGSDMLFVEINDLHKIQRYVSFHRKAPKLNRLNGRGWKEARTRAEKGAENIAKDLLLLQAKRENAGGFAFSKDTDWQKDLEKDFPYTETPDQEKAALEVKKDMEKPKPMDRLLCGDVGYGKTEVALRAVFKAVMDNKQVAVLVPTTILAEQHYETFTSRLKNFPVKIEMLNRFRTDKEQTYIANGIRSGEVDVVIGTHRLLSKDIEFKNLGLLVIDEEQRFGVKHKEKMKRMRVDVDILTLSATPIPRTLYLAASGAKDISIIETPPLKRWPIETIVTEYDKQKVAEAIKNELDRNGQVYYVHNRVETIAGVAMDIQKMVPGAKVSVGHGQMNAKTLEKTMLGFIHGKIDVLVCTTIIESGIDIPNANTMIVDHADRFGLADLYQLRGRIGRFDKKAYAYLLVRDMGILTYEVQARLSAIKKYEKLGSGFKVAMRDLEMRGAGNILGVEQSGFIDQVGFDFYCRLLREEIVRQRAK